MCNMFGQNGQAPFEKHTLFRGQTKASLTAEDKYFATSGFFHIHLFIFVMIVNAWMVN